VMKPVILYADRLPPLVGGMEIHARYFIEHFKGHSEFPLVGVVTKDRDGSDMLVGFPGRQQCLSDDLAALDPAIVFFNSGRWIEQLRQLRSLFPQALFIYRTGGNEIIKAPLTTAQIPAHSARQAFWVDTINQCVNQLVTNSYHTEQRLASIGISPSLFLRCVGGVRPAADPQPARAKCARTRLCCVARFVPYKNHKLLLDVVSALVEAGFDLELRLVGDGPLMKDSMRHASLLGARVVFLGNCDNETACAEIKTADYYVQFSTDQRTEVSGGSYIHSEGMGRSILEAIARGTFVIALRAGALPEIVTPDRGLLLEPGPLKTLVVQIASLLSGPVRHPRPTNEYDWPIYFNRYELAWRAMCVS
jgi:glycosyltransferase involved in cell wall biosynthesis